MTEDDVAFFADPGSSIGYLTRIAFRSFSRKLETMTIEHGVTAGQWRFLRVLWQGDGITQRELSRKVGMKEPTTVIALKSLERSGFVVRAQSEIDRRRSHVFLTDKAKALEAELLPCVAEVNRTATRGMSAADSAKLRDLLRQVNRNLEDAAEALSIDAEAAP